MAHLIFEEDRSLNATGFVLGTRSLRPGFTESPEPGMMEFGNVDVNSF